MLFKIKAEQKSPWAGNPHVHQCLRQAFRCLRIYLGNASSLDVINIYDTHNHHQNYFGGWTFWAQKSHLRFVPTHYRVSLAYLLS